MMWRAGDLGGPPPAADADPAAPRDSTPATPALDAADSEQGGTQVDSRQPSEPFLVRVLGFILTGSFPGIRALLGLTPDKVGLFSYVKVRVRV